MAAQLRRLQEIYPSTSRSTVPLGVRVNDMVYTTSLSAADPVTGEIGGDVKEQTAKVLAKLKELVERAGGTLDNVARAVGYCTKAEDRGPVDEVWMSLFPNEQNKPCMKVLVANLPPGHLVRIDALALLGQHRRRFDIPNVSAHDPTIKVGNWVFSSRCHGNDQTTGQVVPGGLEAETRQTLDNLATLVRLAGGNETDIVQLTTFGRDPGYIPTARRIIEERFPDPAKRPAINQMVNFVTPPRQIAIEMLAVLEGGQPANMGEHFQELYLSPKTNSLPAGAKIGPLVVAPWLLPVDPATQTPVGGDMEEQLRAVFRNMDIVLQAGGCGRQDVARITLFMRQVSDRTAMNKVMREWYPDETTRPPNKYVDAALPEGVDAAAQVIALPGGGVRDVEVSGIHHQDYMSLGGLCGNLVTTSRIFGTDPATGQSSQDPDEHTSIVFDNAGRILTLAGGGWDNVEQGTVFYWGDGLRPIVEAQWLSHVLDVTGAPPLHFVETTLGGRTQNGRFLPRLELIAVL